MRTGCGPLGGMRARRRALLATGLAAPFVALRAGAQAPWPEKPVRLVVGYAAGGPTDFVARLIQEPLQALWGQPLVIENRGGANAVLGTEAVARATSDGHTLLLVTSVHATNPALFPKLPYDSLADFTPIQNLYGSPTILLVAAGSPLRTAREVVAAARREPGLAYGTSGNGSSGHFAGAMFARKAGISLTHIAYRGAAPALQDLVGGGLPLSFATLSGALALIRGGSLRPVAVCAPQRLPLLAEVPTLAESDLDIPDTSPWYGVMGPARLPPPVLQRIAADTRAVLRRPEIQARIIDQGGVVLDEGPEEFAARIRREMEESIAMVRSTGIRVE